MVDALKAIKGYYDYGIFQAVQIAAIVALRHGEDSRLAQVAEYQKRRDVLVDGRESPGLERAEAQGEHVRLGPDPRALAARRWARSTSR